MTLYPYGSMVLVWPDQTPPFVAMAGVHGMLGSIPSLEIKGESLIMVVPLSIVMPLPDRPAMELARHVQQGGRA